MHYPNYDQTISLLLQAITQTLTEALDIDGEPYKRLHDGDALPVFSVELEEAEPAEDQPNTDQTTWDCEVAVVVAVAPELDNALMDLQILGMASAHALHGKTGVVPDRAHKIEVIRAAREDMLEGFETYLTWVTRLRVEIVVGDEPEQGALPDDAEILSAIAPKIGPEWQDEYE